MPAFPSRHGKRPGKSQGRFRLSKTHINRARRKERIECGKKNEGKNRKIEGSAAPKSQLFEIQSNKLKPHSIGNSGQTTMVNIAQTVFFLGPGIDPCHGFLAFNFFAAPGFAQLLSLIKVLLPNRSGKQMPAFLIGAAGLPAGTTLACFQTSCGKSVSHPCR